METLSAVRQNGKDSLTEDQIEAVAAEGLRALPLTGKRMLVLIPDFTRTIPLPLFFRVLTRLLLGRVARLDFLVALGTHPPLSEEALCRLVGISADERGGRYAQVGLLNHEWQNPQALTSLGIIPADEVHEISHGAMKRDVAVQLNRRILEYDHLLVCGPVFPHEVAGFSGGNKYFFPGIAGSEIIDFTHWLGALITSYDIIGIGDTPVRRIIDRAAQMIPVARHALCAVTTTEGVAGVFFGTPESAWESAARLSAETHVRYVDRAYQTVLSILPEMYDEIWVGAKGMYKMEPVVADGGEVILYAPHIHEISVVHGRLLREIGYHVRDYFVAQWERFAHYPWGVLAHSTHLRGRGTYVNGLESARIQVTLATGIDRETCHAVNLGYRDPREIDAMAWINRQEQEDLLVVPHAGETLYRLR